MAALSSAGGREGERLPPSSLLVWVAGAMQAARSALRLFRAAAARQQGGRAAGCTVAASLRAGVHAAAVEEAPAKAAALQRESKGAREP